MSSLSPTTPQKRSTLSLSLTAVNGLRHAALFNYSMF